VSSIASPSKAGRADHEQDRVFREDRLDDTEDESLLRLAGGATPLRRRRPRGAPPDKSRLPILCVPIPQPQERRRVGPERLVESRFLGFWRDALGNTPPELFLALGRKE